MSSYRSYTKEECADMMEVRQGAYQILARLWINEVDEDLRQGLKNTAFPQAPETPRLDNAYRGLEGYLRDARPEVLKELASDYAVLCRGVNPRRGADPYESVHLNPLGLMMQDEWEEIFRLYREAGFQRSAEAIESEDHLGIELECMARLCERSATACMPAQTKACQDSLRLQLQLLEGHLLLWVPRFAKAVIEIAKTEFYRSAAIITNEYLAMDAQFVRERMSCSAC